MQLPYHDRYAYSPIIDRPDLFVAGRASGWYGYLGLNIEHFAFGALAKVRSADRPGSCSGRDVCLAGLRQQGRRLASCA